MSFWHADSDLDWYEETRGPDEAELEARERERRSEQGEGDDDEEEPPHDCADSGGEECPGCIPCYQQTGRTVCAYVCTHARYGIASGWLQTGRAEPCVCCGRPATTTVPRRTGQASATSPEEWEDAPVCDRCLDRMDRETDR